MNGRLMIALQGDYALHDEDIRRLRLAAVGGVILFSRNFQNSFQLRQITAAIRRAAARPLLIATDHEGGRVQRFVGDGFTAIPAMATIANHKTCAQPLAKAAGLVLAAELTAHGIDLTFAPVLDIDYGNSNIIGTRAFGTDPDTVSTLAKCLTDGLRQGGIATCGKHFPGHGYATADSHTTLPIDDRSPDSMRNADWLPFIRFAAKPLPLLMTAHILYPAVSDKPATFSAVWLRQILRQELGFRGLIVSDDLSMAGAQIGNIEERLRAADDAGCDLWLVCNTEDIDAACTAATALQDDNEDGNLWHTLASTHHPRTSIGDVAYRHARDLLHKVFH